MVAAAETSTLTPKHILSIIIANLMLESMLYNILFCKNVKNLKTKDAFMESCQKTVS